MTIEQTNEEIIFRLPINLCILELEKITGYLKYSEAVSNSQASELDTDFLANESKKRWWDENKSNFIK
jgi:hypothetical protein